MEGVRDVVGESEREGGREGWKEIGREGWTEREKGKEGESEGVREIGEHSDDIYQMVQTCFNIASDQE